MNLVFVAEVRDGCSVDQMASQNGHFLIRRVLITSLGHDENLLSNYSLLEKGFSPFSLGAKQCESQIGNSKLREILIQEIDPHSYTAAMFAGKSLEEAKQKITVSGQTPLERLVNRLTAGKNALVAAADDISESHGEEVVKTLLTEIEDALGTLKTVAEDDA